MLIVELIRGASGLVGGLRVASEIQRPMMHEIWSAGRRDMPIHAVISTYGRGAYWFPLGCNWDEENGGRLFVVSRVI